MQEHFQLNAVRFNNELELDFWTKGVAAIAVKPYLARDCKGNGPAKFKGKSKDSKDKGKDGRKRTEN